MKKRLSGVLYIAFFFSGIAGLIYEVVWAKYLCLIFGNTTYAYSLVLATFMGGLALGSYTLGRQADRVKDTLRFFAWIEIGIAVYCLFTPLLFSFSKNLYIAITQTHPLISTSPLLIILKFAISALIILIPTVLMGGTLPILTRFLTRSFAVRGRTVARLYYINSFGAVAGALLAGFILIHRFGLALTTSAAVCINLAVGTLVLATKGLYQQNAMPPDEKGYDRPQSEESTVQTAPLSNTVVMISLWGIFASGCAAMLYEVIWVRLLSMVLGSSTYAFTLMLTAFISGITLGAFIISRYLYRNKNPVFMFALCELSIGISLILSLPFYEKLPFLFFRLSQLFVHTPETFLLYSAIQFFLAFLVMLVPTIFMGMTLPLVANIASRSLKDLGRTVGSAFAFNAWGNIVGSLATGLILIQLLGLKGCFEAGIVINLAIGIVILFSSKAVPYRRALTLTIACCLTFITYKTLVPEWNKAFFTNEVFRHRRDWKNSQEFASYAQRKQVLYYKDGVNTSVAVIMMNGEKILFVNGKADASARGDMPTQILMAHIPLILQPDSKDVLVVGLGSGLTCTSALLHDIQSLDLIEISPAVIEANKFFAEENKNVLRDARLHCYQEDAKIFLRRTPKQYDLIISEPSNPWMSGIGSLFSLEFFRDCQNKLSDNGVMIQWVQAYEINDATLKIILSTFSSIFPEVQIWTSGLTDILLIGANEPLAVDFEKSAKRFQTKDIRDDLARIKIDDLFTFFNLQLSSNMHLRRYISGAELTNSDYHPILSYRAPLGVYTRARPAATIAQLDLRGARLTGSDLLLEAYLKKHDITAGNLSNLYRFLEDFSFPKSSLFRSLVYRWYREQPDDKNAQEAYARYNVLNIEKGLELAETIFFENPNLQVRDLTSALRIQRYTTLHSYLMPEILTDTLTAFNEYMQQLPEKKETLYLHIAAVHLTAHNYDQTLRYYHKAEEIFEAYEDPCEETQLAYLTLLKKIALHYLENKQYDQAILYAEKIRSLNKDDTTSQYIIKSVHLLASEQHKN